MAKKVSERQNEREVQKQFDLEKATEVENELKMLKERKRQVQEINKQVWLDQIALNKKHKKLNLWVRQASFMSINWRKKMPLSYKTD